VRCLIVDDNVPFLEAARSFLEQEGLTVAGLASTSTEALRQAASLRPDVVLVDVALGEENGIELAQRLLDGEGGSGFAVILISTRCQDDVADLIAPVQAPSFLTKAELSAGAIRRIVEGKAP
jgi:two-component system nitrate/nitrite response regulator NarL